MPTELSSLIRGEASIADIAAYLDGLDAAPRAAEANALARAEQARLFDKAADAPPIGVEHFVPRGLPDLTPVHHPGRNTIMTLPYFQRFEKRFARAADGSGRLFGYNASNAWFVTPGYFVAYETREHASWAERGGVVVDYHQVPDADVPAGWPRVVDNGKGLQRLVYHLTRDFMRQVSRHVSIGRASREDERGDRLLDYWFTLCRQDRSATA
ncbi:MAG: hypothetical protein KF729_37695 [Sandaracinaceae bacterium]|nr:hypothetical protein [Sandaracinaceae bacterium]